MQVVACTGNIGSEANREYIEGLTGEAVLVRCSFLSFFFKIHVVFHGLPSQPSAQMSAQPISQSYKQL